eukprot:758558-Hanusia_phi.AAC.1
MVGIPTPISIGVNRLLLKKQVKKKPTGRSTAHNLSADGETQNHSEGPPGVHGHPDSVTRNSGSRPRSTVAAVPGDRAAPAGKLPRLQWGATDTRRPGRPAYSKRVRHSLWLEPGCPGPILPRLGLTGPLR